MISKPRFFSLALLAVALNYCGSKDVRKAEIPPEQVEAEPEEAQPELREESKPVADAAVSTGSLKTSPPVIKKAKKSKRGRFNFSSDEFVKESGTNPFEKKNDTIMRLKGHAKVSSQNLKMVSPHIEIYGDDGRMAYARGPVEVTDTRSDTRITADEALFIRAENRAIMRGNAKLVTTVKGKKGKRDRIQLTAHELERNFETSVSIARGHVVATSANGVLYANQAEFIEPQDLLRSDSDPRIFSASDLFIADSIQWNVGLKSADFHGHVRAYFKRPDTEEGRKASKKSTDSMVRSEEGTLLQSEDLPHGQRLTLHKKVAFERKNYSAFSDEAEIFGSGGELVKAKGRVVLINREENSKSYGDFFEWMKQSGFMALTARKGTRTRTVLHNKKNEPTAEISASSVTRATVQAHPQARGNVQIMQFSRDKSAEPVRMGGEWAEMRRAEKVIQLNGSPYVEGNMGRIGARDIILYYEEQRYEMLGIQPGIVEKKLNPEEQ